MTTEGGFHYPESTKRFIGNFLLLVKYPEKLTTFITRRSTKIYKL